MSCLSGGSLALEVRTQMEILDLSPGHFGTGAIEGLVREIKKLKPGQVYVEVGSFYGKSLFVARCAADWDLKVCGVDLLPNPGIPRTTFYQGDSVEIAKDFNEKIDLLFIDGDHTYEGVRRDIRAWCPKAKTILFHDYDQDSVKRAVDEYCKVKTFISKTCNSNIAKFISKKEKCEKSKKDRNRSSK